MTNEQLIALAETVTTEASKKFEKFSAEYIKYEQNLISLNVLLDKFKKMLYAMPNNEQAEYNEIGKCFSETNCWYADYQSAQILNRLFMKNKYNNLAFEKHK